MGIKTKTDVPLEISELIHQRDKAIEEKDFTLSEGIKLELEQKGYNVYDTDKGTEVAKK